MGFCFLLLLYALQTKVTFCNKIADAENGIWRNHSTPIDSEMALMRRRDGVVYGRRVLSLLPVRKPREM